MLRRPTGVGWSDWLGVNVEIILNDQDYRCVWPDGEARTVRVHKIVAGKAWILWNEQHEPMEIPNPPGPPLLSTVVGCDDQVPVEWLQPCE